jgi:DNA repair exonuclease SbcCD ATPase subunit
MILTSVEVQGVRCFLEPQKVDFSSERLNVIGGPNGAGKSTFVEAVRRCLLDSHTSAAASDLAPWSDARTPEITVEFEHRGNAYRLTKRFLKRKSATLEQKKGSRWNLLHEGKEADEAVRGMLLSGGRNDAGIFSVLWAPQNGLAMDAVSKPVIADLREALGSQLGHLHLEKKIQKLWEDNFQPARGVPKKGRLHEIVAEVEGVREAAEKARTTLEQADQHSGEASELREQLQAINARLNEREPQILEADAIIRKVRELTALIDEAAKDRELIETRLKAATQNAAALEEESRRLEEFEADVPILEAKHNRALDEEAEAAAAEVKALDGIRGLEGPDPEEELLKHQLRLAERWHEFSITLKSLDERLQTITELNAREQQHRGELGASPAPSKETLDAIRKASEELRTALVWLEKLELRIELIAESAIQVEVTGGAPEGCTALSAGSAVLVRGNDGVTARIPGIATMRVSGSETDTADWQKRAAEARERLRLLCEPFGSQDVDELAGNWQRRITLEAALQQVAGERDRVLNGATEGELRQQLRIAEEERQSLGVSEPDLNTLRRALEGASDVRQQSRRTAEAAWRSAFEILGQKRTQAREAEAAITRNREERLACARRLRELRADGKADEQRRLEIEDLTARLQVVKSRLEPAQAERARLPEDAEQTCATLHQDQEADRVIRTDLQTRLAQAEAAQRVLLAQGSYSTLAEAEEDIERLTQELTLEQKRLDGIKRLWTAYQEQKNVALNGVAEPVARRATELLAEFAGKRVAKLTLSEDLALATVSPADAGREAELTELSGGEQELIQISVRLALAETVSRSERQMVVLDDVLLNIDDTRLSRILQYLERSHERLQVVVLTCHPERYGALENVSRVAFGQPAAALAVGG